MTDNDVFERNIDRLIYSAGPAIHLAAPRKTEILQSLTGKTAQPRKSIRTIIMKSWITKLAVAAAIVIAVVFGIRTLSKPKDIREPDTDVAVVKVDEHNGTETGTSEQVQLRQESDQIERMYATSDVDGLVRMLWDGRPASKVLAANYLAKIGDARAISALELLHAQSKDPNNPFARAEAMIKTRLQHEAPKTRTEEANDVNVANLARSEPNTVKLPTAVNIAASGSMYDHFLFTRRDAAEGREGTKTLVLANITAEGFELRDVYTTPILRYPVAEALYVTGGVLYGIGDEGLMSVNLSTGETNKIEHLRSIHEGSDWGHCYDDGCIYGWAGRDDDQITLRALDFRTRAYRDIAVLDRGLARMPLAVSPDHKRLAYFAEDPNGHFLTVVDVDSGEILQPSEPIEFVIPGIASVPYGVPIVWIDSQRVACIRTEVIREDPNNPWGKGQAMHKLAVIDAITGQIQDITPLPGNPHVRFSPELIQDYIGVGPRVRMRHGDLGTYRLDVSAGKLVEDDTINGDYAVSDGYLFHGEKELGAANRDHLRVSPDAKRAIWVSEGTLFYHDGAQEAAIPVPQAGSAEGVLLWLRHEDLRTPASTGQTPAGWTPFEGRPHREPPERARGTYRLPRNHISYYLASTLETDKDMYHLHEPVYLTFTLTNISDSDIKLMRPVVFDTVHNRIVKLTLSYPGGSKMIDCGADPYGPEEREIVLKAGESVSVTDTLEVTLVGDYHIEYRYEGNKDKRYRGDLIAEPAAFRVNPVEAPDEEQRLREAKFARLMERLRGELDMAPEWHYANNTVGDEVIGIPGMGPKVAPYIIEVLQYETNPSARQLLWRPLSSVAGPNELPFFAERLMQGEAEPTCGWMYNLYKKGQQGSEEAFAALLSAMNHENAGVRHEVSKHLAQIYDPSVEACLRAALEDQDEQIRIRASRYLAAAEWLDLDQWLDLAANEPTAARYLAAKSIIKELEDKWNITKSRLPEATWEEASKNPEELEQFRNVVRAWQEWASENLRFSSEFFEREHENWVNRR